GGYPSVERKPQHARDAGPGTRRSRGPGALVVGPACQQVIARLVLHSAHRVRVRALRKSSEVLFDCPQSGFVRIAIIGGGVESLRRVLPGVAAVVPLRVWSAGRRW